MLNFRARKVLISPTDHNYRLEVKLDKLAVSKYLDKNQKITTNSEKSPPSSKNGFTRSLHTASESDYAVVAPGTRVG